MRSSPSTSLDDLKAYLSWQLVNASADMTAQAFADADFDFFSRTLGGQEEQLPRWQRCVTETDAELGEALGKAFVEEAFGGAAKSRHARDGRRASRRPWGRTSTTRRG